MGALGGPLNEVRPAMWTGMLLVVLLALVMGVGGVSFGLAFRHLGEFRADGGFLQTWILNPYVLIALALGVGARVMHYVLLKFYNVSQVTLLAALSIVATLILARLVLDERLTGTQSAGALLIVAGALLVGR